MKPSYPHLGKAKAAFPRVQAAHNKNMINIRLEGDSRRIILALRTSSNIQDWIAKGTIRDHTKLMSNNFDFWEAIKIHRSFNRCAHEITRWVASNNVIRSITLIVILPCLLDFHSGKDPPLCLVVK